MNEHSKDLLPLPPPVIPNLMAQSGNTLFDDGRLRSSVELMRALAHPLRLRIIALLADQKSACVQTIYTALEQDQSIVSQHLRILRRAGLVLTAREGKFIHYLLAETRLAKAARVASQLAEGAGRH